jgi:FkbH-like protein
MTDVFKLPWLPEVESWANRISALNASDVVAEWSEFVALANTRVDFTRTNQLDRALLRHFGEAAPLHLAIDPIRLAVLGSSTNSHLMPSFRIAALRRGIWLTTYECAFGQYLQELSDPNSPLHEFQPNAVLFTFDARHLTQGLEAGADSLQSQAAFQEIMRQLRECWRLARESFGCQILQQAALPVFPPLLGSNEHRLPGSRHWMVTSINAALRTVGDEDGIDLLAVDDRVAQDGLALWHDPILWHRAKQEISPLGAPLYGDLAVRLLVARLGRSYKCLVLDLDDTLWGGVIGDDGLEGIVLGQGSTLGEAFVAFQQYVKALSRRGIILAVCSKNNESTALSAFTSHPEMVLKHADMACFVCNWQDKAANIQAISKRLNIGLDSMVLVDDNLFERDLVRSALPMVAVPELPDDPALFAQCLADAGYFESLVITDEDTKRSKFYQVDTAREMAQASSTDLKSYLRELQMELTWTHFDRMNLQRIVQLINKTNQFNLTTRRYTQDNVLTIMQDKTAFGLQFRLVDRLGDNGIIAIVIGRRVQDDVELDSWLMSCRVLGRQIENASLSVIVSEARRLGGTRLIGEYRPTARNGIVSAHYENLGFSHLEFDTEGNSRSQLHLAGYVAPEFNMIIRKSGSSSTAE